MTLSIMDYWRLSDELSVIDAAILVTGNDPSQKLEVTDEENGRVIFDDNGAVKMYQRTDYEGFDAVFKALRNAIFSDRLRATVGTKARPQIFNGGEYGRPEIKLGEGELWLDFGTLVRTSSRGFELFSNRKISALNDSAKMYVLDEPDWSETVVDVADLKTWLNGRGLHPPFFFPEGKAEGFRDKSHARYSAKLACAVAAWESVEKAQAKKSVKETVTAWVMSNAVSFGLANSDGIVPKLSVEDVAKVVNWATSGGATPTVSAETQEASQQPINNFKSFPGDDKDDDVPF